MTISSTPIHVFQLQAHRTAGRRTGFLHPLRLLDDELGRQLVGSALIAGDQPHGLHLPTHRFVQICDRLSVGGSGRFRGAISTCRGRCFLPTMPRTYLPARSFRTSPNSRGQSTAECFHRRRARSGDCDLQALEGAKGYLNSTANTRSLVSAKLRAIRCGAVVGVNAGFLWTSPTNGRSA